MTGYFGSFVTPVTLATPVDYHAWTFTAGGTDPINLLWILRSCSQMVLGQTEGAYYGTDPATGLATDATQLATMRDATCIQAAAWVKLGIDPSSGGVLTPKQRLSARIGNGGYVNEQNELAQAAAAKAAAYNSLVPEAYAKLQMQNLIGTNVWYYG